jgi:DNA-binding transcriptional LysR family regulator
VNWDDLKYFLAVYRCGSIRAAAKELAVNHATVSRRINSFESALNERLFERSAKGYTPTKAAEGIFQEASHLEERLNTVERKVVGKDKTLKGEIRVTLADVLAQTLFMSDFADFCRMYPQIQLEVVDSARNFNLASREADVALRICNHPPEHLIGRKIAKVHRAGYIARSMALDVENDEWLRQQNWIGWTDKQRRPVGKVARDYPRFGSKHKIVSGVLQMEACKNGMGVSVLPCFMADKDPELMRVPPYTTEHKYDLWILSHPDLRENLKIQTFIRFITERVMDKRALIEGDTFELMPL